MNETAHAPEHEHDPAETIEHGAEGASWISRAMHGFETASHAFPALEHGMGAASEAVPYIGAIASGASAGANAALAAHEFASEGYHSDKAWDHVGGTLLGGAGVAVNALPPPVGLVAGGALALGEAATDAYGHAAKWGFGEEAGFTADSVVGGMARGMFGDRSLGDGTREAIANGLGGGAAANVLGGVVGTAENVALMPVNAALTAGRGLYNEGAAIGHAIFDGEGQGVIGHGLNSAGRAVGNAASSAWDWATGSGPRSGGAAVDAVRDGAVNASGHILGGARGVLDADVQAVHAAGGHVLDAGRSALGDLGDGIVNTTGHLGGGITQFGRDLGHGHFGAALGDVGSTALQVGGDVLGTAGNVARDVGRGAYNVVGDVATGLGSAAGAVGNAAVNVAHDVGGAASGVWHSIFG